MKKLMKKLVVAVLGRQVRRLRQKHQFKIVGVVGSIGKTSTKFAVAQVLGKHVRVCYQEGNYNDIVSVPLIFFGQTMPTLFNPLAWYKIFADNNRQIKGKYPYDIVVVELGTDAPGQILAFKKYLKLDIAVITSVTPEHMEHFADLEAVAEEELSVAQFSDQLVYNADLISEEHIQKLPAAGISYSMDKTTTDFYLANLYRSYGGFEGDVKHQGEIFMHISDYDAVSEAQLYSILAAVIVGNQCGLTKAQLLSGLSAITPVSGRLRRLNGKNRSIIIDDTYNASPDAVKAGLHSLYKIDAPMKFAILGNMNELGEMSAAAHKEIGDMCDPDQLNMLITIGPDANTHLASAARGKGCNVISFENPYDAGEFLQSKLEPGSVVFAKGSQNNVFAEEAVKLLLADPEDAAKLVRQSDYWLKRKERNFRK